MIWLLRHVSDISFFCNKHSRTEQVHRAQCPLAANASGYGQDILLGQNAWWWITRTGHWFPTPCSNSGWQLFSGVRLLTSCNASHVYSHFWVWMQMAGCRRVKSRSYCRSGSVWTKKEDIDSITSISHHHQLELPHSSTLGHSSEWVIVSWHMPRVAHPHQFQCHLRWAQQTKHCSNQA